MVPGLDSASCTCFPMCTAEIYSRHMKHVQAVGACFLLQGVHIIIYS